MISQEQYVELLKDGVAKYGLSEFARQLGVDRRHLHRELNAPDILDRKYGKHDKSRIVEALGLRRVQTVSYEPIPGGPMDETRKARKAEAKRA